MRMIYARQRGTGIARIRRDIIEAAVPHAEYRQNALLITPPSTLSAAPVMADAGGVAMQAISEVPTVTERNGKLPLL
jgi:hypothetical protein